MVATDDSRLATAIDVIVARIHPRRIILFGSQARGDARPDSDYDLLIVEDDADGPQPSPIGRVGQLHVDMFRKDVPPLDLLLYSQTDYDRWSQARSHVVAQAAREGKVVYERG